MLATLILSTILCFGYIIYTKIKYPKLASISESYYLGFPFTYWCIFSGFTLLPSWLDQSPEEYQFIAFLSTAIFIFLGAYPRYRLDLAVSHSLCAILAGLLAIIWITINTHWIFGLLTLVMLCGIGYNNLWLAEVFGLIGLYLSLYLNV